MFKKIINKFKPKPIKKVYCRDCINMFIHNQPFDITSCSMKKIKEMILYYGIWPKKDRPDFRLDGSKNRFRYTVKDNEKFIVQYLIAVKNYWKLKFKIKSNKKLDKF